MWIQQMKCKKLCGTKISFKNGYVKKQEIQISLLYQQKKYSTVNLIKLPKNEHPKTL